MSDDWRFKFLYHESHCYQECDNYDCTCKHLSLAETAARRAEHEQDKKAKYWARRSGDTHDERCGGLDSDDPCKECRLENDRIVAFLKRKNGQL